MRETSWATVETERAKITKEGRTVGLKGVGQFRLEDDAGASKVAQ